MRENYFPSPDATPPNLGLELENESEKNSPALENLGTVLELRLELRNNKSTALAATLLDWIPSQEFLRTVLNQEDPAQKAEFIAEQLEGINKCSAFFDFLTEASANALKLNDLERQEDLEELYTIFTNLKRTLAPYLHNLVHELVGDDLTLVAPHILMAGQALSFYSEVDYQAQAHDKDPTLSIQFEEEIPPAYISRYDEAYYLMDISPDSEIRIAYDPHKFRMQVTFPRFDPTHFDQDTARAAGLKEYIAKVKRQEEHGRLRLGSINPYN